jgi:DNA primase catalytic subunit
MDKKKTTKRTVRYIDFDGGRDYRSWLTENFPSKTDKSTSTKPGDESPNDKA